MWAASNFPNLQTFQRASLGQRQLLTNTAACAPSDMGLWCTMLAELRVLRRANGLLPSCPADRRAGRVHHDAPCAAMVCHLSGAAPQGIESIPLALLFCVRVAGTNGLAQGCALKSAPARGGAYRAWRPPCWALVANAPMLLPPRSRRSFPGKTNVTGKVCGGAATTRNRVAGAQGQLKGVQRAAAEWRQCYSKYTDLHKLSHIKQQRCQSRHSHLFRLQNLMSEWGAS